jgi:putative protease
MAYIQDSTEPLLLAPAGSLDAAAQALSAGADAIYAGLKGWSRGGPRTELERQQLSDCIRLAHSLRKQVHLAVNTIIKPVEYEIVLRELSHFFQDGIDAVILNDIGLIRAIKQHIPGLPITVSVGCGALNVDDVLFYQELGAAAVVLPGYLAPEEIALIKARATVRIEVMLHMVEEFIQLGKCWMPSYFNFAAAQRPQPERLVGSVKQGGVGSCFRICQQTWAVTRDNTEIDCRLLPSRQISSLSEVAAFLDAGVDAVKIQGRSQFPAMVGVLVAAYRSAIVAWRAGRQFKALEPELPTMWTVQGR